MERFLEVAISAARLGGKVIGNNHDKISSLTIEHKEKNDYVSQVDKLAEKEVIAEIKRSFPTHSILGEESGEEINADSKGYKWVIDPLDGTTNFLHSFPQYSVSIGLFKDEVPIVGVVYDPFKEELFYAQKGKGAFLTNKHSSDKKINITNPAGFADTLIGTGFPFKQPQYLDCYLETFKAIHPHVAGIRRAGSAALDLAYVAAGRLDGFWEIGLNIWDIAAGVLLVEEAGGHTYDFSGNDKYFSTGNIVCGGQKISKEILTTIKPFLIDGVRS
jgi:myo-inositol-1(or 4)-monophosphatase